MRFLPIYRKKGNVLMIMMVLWLTIRGLIIIIWL